MIRRNVVLACVSLAIAIPVAAQEAAVVLAGRIVDAEERPAVGYRVVLRDTGGTQVYLSAPADDEGNYNVSVPSGQPYVVVAVIAPNGRRTALPALPPIAAQPGARQDVALPFSVVAGASAWPATFPEGDRLFLAWAEDATIVDGWQVDAGVVHEEFDAGSVDGVRVIGAVSFESIPRIEFGGRIGFEDAESDSGLTDMDAWAKLDLGRHGAARFAVGGIATLPTGDSDAGTGTDTFSSKLFGAVRFAAAPFLVSAHAGVRFTGDGEVAGFALDGTTSFDAGVSAIWPRGDRLALVGETFYEAARFDGLDDDARILFGANWKLIDFGHARLAVGAGLTDAAPDWFLIAGWSF